MCAARRELAHVARATATERPDRPQETIAMRFCSDYLPRRRVTTWSRIAPFVDRLAWLAAGVVLALLAGGLA